MKRLRKILLVDDDEITCYLEKSLLEDLEVSDSIECVHGGYEALDYLQGCREKQCYPNLIFLDINMPGMDGFELLERLEALGSSEIRKLNIVMLTSSVNIKDVQTAASFGDLLKGYITKPLEIGAVKKYCSPYRKRKNNRSKKNNGRKEK